MRVKTLLIMSAVAALSAAPAFAADNSAGTSSTAAANSSAASSSDANHIGQTLRQDLTKAGFTDVRVEPEAFIVHAKNSSGEPVVMRIGPDTVTTLTEVPTSSQNHTSNGSASTETPTPPGNTAHAGK